MALLRIRAAPGRASGSEGSVQWAGQGGGMDCTRLRIVEMRGIRGEHEETDQSDGDCCVEEQGAAEGFLFRGCTLAPGMGAAYGGGGGRLEDAAGLGAGGCVALATGVERSV
jgi:hypothetical protein